MKIVSIPQAQLGNPASWTVNPGSSTSFTLTFLGATTISLTTSGLTAAAMQSALQALSTIGPGGALVTLSSGIFTVTMAGSLALISQPSSALTGTGTGGSVTIAQINAGSAALSVPQIKLEDTQNIGTFYRSAIGDVAIDTFPLPGGPDVVFGGQMQIGVGLQINLFPPLRIYRTMDGVLFELMANMPIPLTLQDADPVNPRIDLIVAIEQEQTPSATETRHYRVSPPVPGNQEGDVQVATQLWDQLQIQVITGTPAVSPAQPPVPADGIPLYVVTVPANTTQLVGTMVSDVRNGVLTQAQQDQAIEELQSEVNSLMANQPPYPASEVLIGPGAGAFSNETAQAAFAQIASWSDTSSYDPITRPQTLTSDGRLQAVGRVDTDSVTPVVDVPPGSQIAFSNVVRNINQTSIPATANPRLVNIDVNAGTQSVPNNVSPLTLSNVLDVISNGPGTFVQKNGTLPVPRAFGASAARDGRYIENYGGASATGSLLSNWSTYDTLADQVTSQTLTGAIPPPSARCFMAPCGDGVHVLLGCPTGSLGSIGQTPPQWFIINTSTWVSTAVSGGPSAAGGTYPFYWAFTGDLIQSNTILICTQSASPNTYWSFTWSAGPTTDGVFTKLNVSGAQPQLAWESSEACLYQPGLLVEFETSTGTSNAGNATYLFNYGTLTWTKQAISSPVNLFGEGGFFDYFGMKNFGGLPTVVGGTDSEGAGSGFISGYWQLTPGTPPSWQGNRGNLANKWMPTVASLIANGLPQGQGYILGGSGSASSAQAASSDIWTFTAGGVVVTTYNGLTGLTLAPGTSTATIQFTNFQVPTIGGPVETYLISLFGYLPPGSAQISITLNGGAGPPQQIIRDAVTSVANSGNPSIRTLQITLAGSGSLTPILTGFSEMFEVEGGPGLTGTFVRFNAPSGAEGLYINRDGSMFFSTNINQSTPGTAILLSITNNGSGVAPSLVNFVNRRWFELTYSAAKGSGTPQFFYDGAVSPYVVKAVGITGGQNVGSGGTPTGAQYALPVPAVNFNSTVTVANVQASADFYSVTAIA
ncbi:MAG TPA: hypothetical protein VLZ81_09300 [Blastocatellia bacterium]|nr:hypothetical protein [Blastocatellia bacterium]